MAAVKGVLVDVDGTLVDSNVAHAQAWVRALAARGFEAPFDRVRRLIGKGGDKLLPEVSGLAPESPQGKEIRELRQEIFRREFLPAIRPFPKVKELLAKMKQAGLKLVVASSATDEELQELLKLASADQFVEASTSSDDADRSKPDPDIIVAALERLGTPAAQTLLLGDTPYDLEAGQRAGISVVAVRCGGWSDADLAQAVAIYQDPADLLAHFESSPFSR